jgi:heparanase 1
VSQGVVGYQISGAQLARDVAAARALLDAEIPGSKLGAPSSAFWPAAGEFIPFYPDFMAAGGAASLDVVTWHYYPAQSVRCPIATRRASLDVLLDPATLDEVEKWAGEVEGQRDAHAPGKPVWLGETGGAQCGGEPGLSDAFADGFFWLDELAKVARRGEPTIVRQTLAGSSYGLVDDATLAPRPDYWTSVLWRRLVGATVLDVQPTGDPLLRAYAHCARGGPSGAVVLVVSNLDRARAVDLAMDPIFPIATEADAYELSSDDLASSEVRLNGGAPLVPSADGSPPPLDARSVAKGSDGSLHVRFAPATYGFIVVPGAAASVCR